MVFNSKTYLSIAKKIKHLFTQSFLKPLLRDNLFYNYNYLKN